MLVLIGLTHVKIFHLYIHCNHFGSFEHFLPAPYAYIWVSDNKLSPRGLSVDLMQSIDRKFLKNEK
jgi:hypothetical protein